MKVKLKTSMAGPDFALRSGDEWECSDDEGIRLVEAGLAVPADKPKPASRESKRKVEKREA